MELLNTKSVFITYLDKEKKRARGEELLFLFNQVKLGLLQTFPPTQQTGSNYSNYSQSKDQIFLPFSVPNKTLSITHPLYHFRHALFKIPH